MYGNFEKIRKVKISMTKIQSYNKQYSYSWDEDEKNQKQRNFVNRKLLSSIQQSLEILLQCITTSNINQQLFCKIMKKREKDLNFLQSLKQSQVQKDKEEYCTLIYFKLKTQLLKFPQEICKSLSKSIHYYYNEMIANEKLNIFKFFKKIKNKIDQQIDKIIKPMSGKQNHTEGITLKVIKIEQIFGNIEHIYGIMDIDFTEINQNIAQMKKNYFIYLEDQFKRNQKILRNIFRFSNKMKKQLNFQRFRIFSMKENVLKRTIYTEKIKKSVSICKVKELPYKQMPKFQKQNVGSKIYLRPIIKPKKKLII